MKNAVFKNGATRRNTDVARRVVIATLGMAALATSCADENPSFFIVQAQVANGSGDACEIESGLAEEFLAEGLLDVALDRDYPYVLYPAVQNNLPALGANGLVEINDIRVDRFSIEIQAPPGVELEWSESCPETFDRLAPARISPSTVSALQTMVLLPCHTAQIRQMFLSGQLPSGHDVSVIFRVVVRAEGEHGSSSIESGPFAFPIRVCYGCLQTGFSGAEFQAFNFPTPPSCDQVDSNPFRGNRCNPAQDMGPILCCIKDRSKNPDDPANLTCPAGDP